VGHVRRVHRGLRRSPSAGHRHRRSCLRPQFRPENRPRPHAPPAGAHRPTGRDPTLDKRSERKPDECERRAWQFGAQCIDHRDEIVGFSHAVAVRSRRSADASEVGSNGEPPEITARARQQLRDLVRRGPAEQRLRVCDHGDAARPAPRSVDEKLNFADGAINRSACRVRCLHGTDLYS